MEGEQFLRAAYAYLYIHDFERAAMAFEKAIASDPDNPEYYFHASITLLRSGNKERALFLAQRAVQLEPENQLYQEHVKMVESSILTEDGQRALERGELDVAREMFNSALERNPLDYAATEALALLDAAGN